MSTEYSSQAFTANQVHNMASAQANLQGRSILLKICSSIKFYDQSLKQVTNENIHLMKYLKRRADAKEEEDGETAEETAA